MSLTPLLNRLSKDISDYINTHDMDTKRERRVALRDIKELIDTTYSSIEDGLLADLNKVIEDELLKAAIVWDKYVEPPKEEDDSNYLLLLFLGADIKTHLKLLKQDIFVVVSKKIVQGFADDLTPRQVAQNIRGTAKNKYKDGVFNTARNDFSAMTNSAIQRVTDNARERFWKKQGVEKVIWISVLDEKTTAICRGRSNKIYNIGEGPRPPAHYRCRSKVVPYTEGLEVPPSYSEWLRSQDDSVIDGVLGKTKGAMFRSGKLKLDGYVTPSGREMTIEELKQL